MEIEMPENFPYETPPQKGDVQSFLVDAKYLDGKKWDVMTIDGVPAGSPGKANAPGDMGEGPLGDEEEGIEEPPPEDILSGEESGEPSPAAPAEAMPPANPPSVGAAFSKKVMGG